MMTAPESPNPINTSEPGSEEDLDGVAPHVNGGATAGRSLPRGFLIARLALLAGVMGVAGLIAWAWNEKRHGAAGAELAIFSMVSCTISAGTALLVVGVTAGGENAFAGVMSSILFRTLGPLAAAAVWQLSHPAWPTDNLIQIHVPMFLVSLTVETILVIDIVCSSDRLASSLIDSTSGKGRAPR